ncbi:MAG: biopolymer transporter ExbD [Planctomycetota bacterium]
MKLSNRQRALESKRLEISMTGMIDVVFLLLIFFLVTTSFNRQERQIDSNIQVQREASGLSNTDIEPAIMIIHRSGEEVVFQLGTVRSTNLSTFDPILNNYLGKSNGGFVQVDDGIPFNNVAKAIGKFKVHGFPNVSYLPQIK